MSKRLIYADDAIKELSDALAIVLKDNEKSAKFIIDRVPPAQSEIVRCKDCVHRPTGTGILNADAIIPAEESRELFMCRNCVHHDKDNHWCKVWKHGIGEEDCCSYGEAKGESDGH